jgi:hypothetical protein
MALPNHDAAESGGSFSTHALAISLCALNVIRSALGLSDTCHERHSHLGDRIDRDPHRKLKLQPCCKQYGVLQVIHGIEVGNRPENTLVLFEIDFVNRDLRRRSVNGDRTCGSRKPELYISQKEMECEDDRGGIPFVETIRRDPYLIGNSELNIAKFERGGIVRGCDLLLSSGPSPLESPLPPHRITI